MLNIVVQSGSSGFGEKTCQLTHYFRVLEVETRCQLSPESSRPVIEPDRTGSVCGLGHGFVWTPLDETNKYY